MPLKVSASFATVTGSRRRTGAPRSPRGTRLKATTDRAFLVSTGIPPPARATEKACPSLPGVRAGYSQPIHGSTVGLSFKASSRLHRAARRGTRIRHHFGRSVAGPFGGCYDRTYPGIPAQPPRGRPRHRAVPRSRPRSRARQLSDLCEGAAGLPRVLRGEGQPGAGSAEPAGLARLVLRLRERARD